MAQDCDSTVAVRSSIEKLPPEIFLRIFTQSRNPAFLFSSKVFHDLITTYDSVKKQLIEFCCQDRRLECTCVNQAHKNMQRLLREEWLTLSWILDARIDWYISHTKRFLNEDLAQIGVPVKERERIMKAHKDFLLEVDKRSIGDEQMDKRHVTLTTAKHERLVKITTTVSWHSVIVQCERPDTHWFRAKHYGDVEGDECITDGGELYLQGAQFLPKLSHSGIFPSTYLRGPWTQTQGEILSLFMTCFDSNWTRSGIMRPASARHCADMSDGLMRALQTRDLAALFFAGVGLRETYLIYGTVGYLLGGSLCPDEKLIDNRRHTRAADRSPWYHLVLPAVCWEELEWSEGIWKTVHLEVLVSWLREMKDANIAELIAQQAVYYLMGKGIGSDDSTKYASIARDLREIAGDM